VNSEILCPLIACGLGGIKSVDLDREGGSDLPRKRSEWSTIGGQPYPQIGDSENACPLLESSVWMSLGAGFLGPQTHWRILERTVAKP
jgi:hypothetical protein